MNYANLITPPLPDFPDFNIKNSTPNRTKYDQKINKLDMKQQDIEKLNAPNYQYSKLPFMTDTTFYNDIIANNLINRNDIVREAQQTGNTTRLDLYTRNYGIINPSQLSSYTLDYPITLTSANRTDNLYNKTITKLFNPSLYPYSNI